jgi:hypothetical protein
MKRIIKKGALSLICTTVLSASLLGAPSNFKIEDGKITEEVLNNYLSHSVTHSGLCATYPEPTTTTLDDDLRMLKHIGAKFIGRTALMWGEYRNSEGKVEMKEYFSKIKNASTKAHEADPEMILQGAILEIITTNINQIEIPEEVFITFGEKSEKRYFDYSKMLFNDGSFVNHWGEGQSVPDMTKLETRMWFYYISKGFIDSGIEAIHFGQVMLMGKNDTDYVYLKDLLSKVRNYAKTNSPKGIVLCDAHSHGFVDKDGISLFDFNSFPLRIMKVKNSSEIDDNIYDKYINSGTSMPAVLSTNFSDNIYNKSKGCITPSGWTCEHLPYIVEFDNWGVSDHPGIFKEDDGIWIWGYDEISWFAHQPIDYRNDWLKYAYNWVKNTDPVGHVQFATRRILCGPVDKDGKSIHMYQANNPSEECPDGFGQENTIYSIWN